MLYILLPIHNRINVTKKIINCLVDQKFKEFQLVLIDDGSTDGSSDYVKSKINNVIVIKGKGDWWWGGSLHQGYKWLIKNKIGSENNILILNDDVVFENDFLQIGNNLIDSNPDSLILSYDYDLETGNLLDSGSNINWEKLIFKNAESIDEINILSTRGLFFKMKVFYEIGGFHPFLIPHYQSDYEFTHRAYRKGFKLLSFPELKIKEDSKQTGIRDRVKGLKGFYINHFSKKSNFYQLSWTSFVWFACPWKWKIKNLIRVSITYRYLIEPIYGFYQLRMFLSRIARNSIVESNLSFSNLIVSSNQNSLDNFGKIEYFKVITIIKGIKYVRFFGWASDPLDHKKPAKSILVVRNKKTILGVLHKFKIKRSDIAQNMGAAPLVNSGFIGHFTLSEFEDLSGIEFYSVSENNRNIALLKLDIKKENES
ncbi:glycosyltransferase family 2 protein [Leptospira sp. GIMC2001]|uniref:glycosyltransferase family 2 protein n=1 Tax=Leptospira sp. GIMC2001 TaxID=1513297 RepID=UPI00234A1040|nr:glycosyltransferase [Leptospira sp. GIMC2001]WCL51261.1 glycosyltransferase [Leptospira sp. GIMC2001]